MRLLFAAPFFFASAFAASAAPAPAPPAGIAQTYEIPAGAKPQTVMILTRTLAPGASAGRHIHHGVEMTIVASGALDLMVDGQPPHVYHAGESFVVPREVPHDAKSVGTTPAILYVTYVIDRGTPPRVPLK